MAKYKCLSNTYTSINKDQIYNGAEWVDKNTSIEKLTIMYPKDWQLVEEFVLPDKWCIKALSHKQAISIAEYASPRNYLANQFKWNIDDSFQYFLHIKKDKYICGRLNIKDNYKEITYDQFIKYVLKEDNVKQEIIGYEFKKGLYTQYNAALNMLLRRSGNSTLYKYKYLIYGWKDAINIFKEAGVLDLWFDPVYKEQYTLPEINGYNGRVDGYNIKYGCANFDINKLRDLYKCKSLSGCRNIKSITLSSDVTITMKEIKQIIDYYDNM